MGRRLRILICWILKLSGLNAFFRFLNRNRILILWYHGISSEDMELLRGYDERHLDQKLFRRHLNFLKKHGFHFISLDEYLVAKNSGQSLEKAVILTFDDGFRNVITNAVPAMKESSAKGVMYVVAECAKTGQLLWTDQVEAWVRSQSGDKVQVVLKGEKIEFPISTRVEKEIAMRAIKRRLRTLSNEERKQSVLQFQNAGKTSPEFQIAQMHELKQMSPSVLQIASHTMTHPNCTQLSSEQEFNFEFVNAKNELEKGTKTPIAHFAYPAGVYNDHVILEVKKANYKTAVTTDPGLNDLNSDPYRLKRIGTNRSFIMFEAMTSGSYFFLTQKLFKRT